MIGRLVGTMVDEQGATALSEAGRRKSGRCEGHSGSRGLGRSGRRPRTSSRDRPGDRRTETSWILTSVRARPKWTITRDATKGEARTAR